MIDTILDRLNKLQTEYNLAKKKYSKNVITIAKERKSIEQLELCKAILIKVGEDTQKELKKYIEETTTMALQTVYGDDYEFLIEFNYDKRDQIEIRFFIKHLGIKLEPRKDTCGGGVIDVCSFALRMICLTLEEPDVAAVLILDEPFKNVSAKYVPLVGQTIVDIADLLNLQIIMVTHIEGFIETANNLIYI
jgi:DNA repair ATPase RecN